MKQQRLTAITKDHEPIGILGYPVGDHLMVHRPILGSTGMQSNEKWTIAHRASGAAVWLNIDGHFLDVCGLAKILDSRASRLWSRIDRDHPNETPKSVLEAIYDLIREPMNSFAAGWDIRELTRTYGHSAL